MTLLAVSTDATTMQLYFEGAPTTALLTNNGDHSFTLTAPIPAGVGKTQVLLEIQGSVGIQKSRLWPYLVVQ